MPMKVRKKIQRLIDKAHADELRPFRLMPDTWWFSAEELADLHPSFFLGQIHGALLVRRADDASGWAAMRLCVRWDPGIEHLRFGVFGLGRGEMVQVVVHLRELDGYEGLHFGTPDDWDQAAQVIDALTGQRQAQRVKFILESLDGAPLRGKLVRWFDRWTLKDLTLVLPRK